MTEPWDRRSLDEQGRVRELILGRWGPLVATTAPFWARRVRAAGIDADAFTDDAALDRLPPATERALTLDAPGGAGAVIRPTEEQVRGLASNDLLTRVAAAIRRRGQDGARDVLLDEYRPVQLTRAGPDGELLVAASRSDLDRSHRAGARAASVLGLTDTDVVLSALPTGPSLAATGVSHLAHAASLTALHAGDDLEAVVHAASLLPASVLVVAADDALTVIEALVAARTDVRRLRLVVTLGPPLGPDDRERIVETSKALGTDVQVRALWAPSVGRSLWAECAEGGSGLHTTPDLERLEVLDPFTGAITDADGDLTLTTMGWHGTALVRLRTGSWVDPLETEPCPACSRTVPRLAGDVLERAWELEVDAGDGRQHHVDLRGVAAALEQLPELGIWRAELRGPSDRVPRDRLIVEVTGRPEAISRAQLADRVARATGLAPELSVGVDPDALDRTIEEMGGVFADSR